MAQSITNIQKSVPPTLADVRSDVNIILDDFYRTSQASARTVHESYGRLWSVMFDNHKAGGKRLRPYLMLLTYHGLGGRERQRVLPVAAALEVLHTCLLAHDDIIDRGYIRHGAPNIAGTYRNMYADKNLPDSEITHYADSAALLAGDLLLAGAYRLINTSTLSASQKIQCLAQLDEAIFIVGGGQLLDTEAAFFSTEAAGALQVARYKTAHYSFVTAFVMGAALAGAQSSTLQKLASAGQDIGVAFQLADDLLGMFGDESATGKSATSDIAEGKRTYLIERGLALTDGAGRQRIHSVLGNPQATQADQRAFKKLLIACGAKTATEAMIAGLYSKALHTTQDVAFDGTTRRLLEKLLATLVWRKA